MVQLQKQNQETKAKRGEKKKNPLNTKRSPAHTPQLGWHK